MSKRAKKISKVLVALDGSKQSMKALDYAIEIARRQTAGLSAVSVLQYIRGEMVPYVDTPVYDKQRISRDRAKIRVILNAAHKKAKIQQVHLNTFIIEGEESISDAIIKYAKSKDFDMIVVGSKNKKGLKRLLLGSVSLDIVSNADCPVLVVK